MHALSDTPLTIWEGLVWSAIVFYIGLPLLVVIDAAVCGISSFLLAKSSKKKAPVWYILITVLSILVIVFEFLNGQWPWTI